MKLSLLYTITLAAVLSSCDNSSTSISKELNNNELILSETIKPNIIHADINGDGNEDALTFVKSTKNNKYGIFIIFKKSGKTALLGAGNSFDAAGPDFRWINNWTIIEPGKTWETTFSDNGDAPG